MSDAVIGKMRADFAVVSEFRLGCGEWDDAYVADLGAAIKTAIDERDEVMLACWSRWLADLAAWVVAWNLVCRGSERRIHEAVKAHRTNQANQAKGVGNGE